MTENSPPPPGFLEVSLKPAEEENPEDVNIQCVQSSEFVVGKQNNFNGPVTIINCVENLHVEHKNQMKDEKIIIRDKVLSQSKPTDQAKKNKKLVEGAKFRGTAENWRNWMLEKTSKHSKILLFVGVGILVLIAIVLGVFFGELHSEPEDTLTVGTHSLYTKRAWGGQPPKSTIKMKLPVPYVIISHTVTPECHGLEDCAGKIRSIQNNHFHRDFADIGENFFVDSDGNIYEGRGWNYRNVMGSFVNGRSIDVALIGDYSEGKMIPSEDLLDGVKQLLEYGVEKEKISRNYSLVAASSIYPTLSPGKNVYKVIKDWPHFDPDPRSHVKEYDV